MYICETNGPDMPLLSWSAEAGALRDDPIDVTLTYEFWKSHMGAEPVVEDFLDAEILADLNDLREGQVLDLVSRSIPVEYYPGVSAAIYAEPGTTPKVSQPVEQIIRIMRANGAVQGEFWDVRTQSQIGEPFTLEQLRGCDNRAPMIGQAVVRHGEYLAGTVQFNGAEPYQGWLFGPICECVVIDCDDPRL